MLNFCCWNVSDKNILTDERIRKHNTILNEQNESCIQYIIKRIIIKQTSKYLYIDQCRISAIIFLQFLITQKVNSIHTDGSKSQNSKLTGTVVFSPELAVEIALEKDVCIFTAEC